MLENRYVTDGRGNVVKRYALDSKGNLLKGTVVTNNSYDNNNNRIETWYTDLSGKAVNYPDSKYSKVRYKYDELGNTIENSWWGTNGAPAVAADGTHKWTKEFDILGQLIHDISYGSDGKPIPSSKGNPEQRYEYDASGNTIKHTVYDGYGKPINGNSGWFCNKRTYNKQGKILSNEYYDKDGKLAEDKSDEYAKATYLWDDNGNNIEVKYYSKASKCQRIERMKYNKQNRQTEVEILDESGNRDDKYGFSKRVTIYEKSGVVPVKREWYDKNNKLLATSTYNKDKQEWNDMTYTSYAQTSNWQNDWYELASQCPATIEEGIIMQSIRITSNSVSITFKLEFVSKYDLDSADQENLKTLRQSFYNEYKEYLPNSVSLYIYIVDRAGRSI